jgi:hypothetical protein
LVVTGLTNGESYTATAYWTLAAGQASLPSTASSVFTPN